jgi:hypothetical protein
VTLSDVVLALFELTPPSCFIRGCVQLPQLSKPFNRNLEGFYCYQHQLNRPGVFEFWKFNLPKSLKSLIHYICPSYCTPDLFDKIVINPATCKTHLVSTSKTLIDHLCAVYGSSNMMTSATIYFEACKRDVKHEKVAESLHHHMSSQQDNKADIPTIER